MPKVKIKCIQSEWNQAYIFCANLLFMPVTFAISVTLALLTCLAPPK